MLSRKDIIDFCGVSEDQVRAIAKRERVSDISAASLGQSLLQSGKRTREIERYIHEEMEYAILCGRVDKEKTCNGSSQSLEAPLCSDSDIVDKPEQLIPGKSDSLMAQACAHFPKP